MAFNPDKYKAIFDKRFGKGSFDAGLSDARQIGTLKVQASQAKQDYTKRLREAQAAAKKAQKAQQAQQPVYGDITASEANKMQAKAAKEGRGGSQPSYDYARKEARRNSKEVGLSPFTKTPSTYDMNKLTPYAQQSLGLAPKWKEPTKDKPKKKAEPSLLNRLGSGIESVFNGLSTAGERFDNQLVGTLFHDTNEKANKAQAKLIASQLKKNPHDKVAKTNAEMFKNAITKKASTPFEKATNLAGGLAGNTLPYAIGDGLLGLAGKGVGAVAKGSQLVNNPLLKLTLNGAASGATGSGVDMAAKRLVDHQKFTPGEVGKNLALNAGAGAVLAPAAHSILSNLNLKGQLDKVMKGTGSQKFNVEAFQSALNDVHPKQQPQLRLNAPQLQLPGPKPIEPSLNTLLNTFKQPKGLQNPIPELPAAMKQQVIKKKLEDAGVGFGQGSKYAPKARKPIYETTAIDPLKRSPEYWQKRYEDFAKFTKDNGYTDNNLSEDAIQELWTHFAKHDEPVNIQQVVDLAYPKGFEAPPKPIPPKPEHPLITALKSDPKINQKIKEFFPPVRPEPKVSRLATTDEIINHMESQLPPKQTPPEPQPLQFRVEKGFNPKLKPNILNRDVPIGLEAISKGRANTLKPGKDFMPIEQQKFGTKLTRLKDNTIPTSDIPSSLPKQEEKIILSQNKNPLDLKRGLNRLYQNTFDNQHLIAGISNDVKVNASNARQTQGVTDFIAEHGLVNKDGVKIGESLKELAQSIPLNKEEDFWRYMSHQHNIARSKEGKNVFSQFNAADSEKEAQKLLAQHPEFKAASEKVTGWINTFMDTWAKDTVGENALKMWREMYPNYLPVYREIDPLKQASFNGAKRGFVNLNNLVKKAKGAKTDLSSNIKDPLGNIAQLVNKTVKAQKNNEVGKSILEEVRKGGLDDLFEVVKTKQGLVDDINQVLKNDGIEGVMDKFTGQFDDVFKQAEKGNNIVKVMENGHEVLLKVKDLDYLKALQSLSEGTGKTAAEQFERAARKVANPIKSLITGKNPLFAIFNIMRDTPTAFIQGAEKNPITFTNRYMRALKGITHNSKGFQEFSAQGGMQSGFFKNDILKTTSQLKNPNVSHFGKFMSKVEGFNNLIEAAPRYMEYMATLEKGGTKAQAIYNAAEVTTNFARNGKWGKFFDSFVLYLNPALQGLDKFVRQVKNKPLQTALKAVGIVTIPQVATEYMNKDNPNYQALDQRLKDDFLLIPNKFGPQDAQGNSETFFRIPKTREYSVVFSVLTNRIGELMRGESLKNASKGVVGSFDRNFSVPTRPIWSPFSDVAKNKDWKDAPINPLGMQLDNRSNYLKYDERTSEIGKFLGKALNEQPIDGLKYSPKDIDYLIQSYTGIIGDILLPAATKSDSALGIPQKKFIADSVYSNQSVSDFYDNLQKLRTRATDNNILGNIPSRAKTQEEAQRNNIDKLSKLISSLNKNIKQTSDVEKQRELRKQVNLLAQKGNSLYDQYTK